MSVLKGVITPNLTPYEDDLTIATGLYLDHAEALLDQGCVGLAPFGTTGEALSVGIEERMAVLEAMVARGIDPARLIPGTGLTNVPDTARLTRHAVDQGCAGALVLPPFYFKGVADDGLYEYFARLIEAVDRPALRIYLYHIPQVSGVGIPPALVQRLHQAFPDTIVGVKDSTGDWENTRKLLAIDGLTVYPGQELFLIPGDELGSAGCISATANLNAANIARLIETIRAGKPDAALAEEIKAFRALIASADAIPAQKALLAHWTGDARWARTRAPLLPMNAGEAARLADQVAALPGYRRPAA